MNRIQPKKEYTVWHSGSIVCHMNKVTLLSLVSTGMGDHLWVGIPSQYVTSIKISCSRNCSHKVF